MRYSDLVMLLTNTNWERVERDDRLFDIFPAETKDKGIELWEKEDDYDTLLLRVRLPYQAKNLKLYTLATSQVGYLLQNNTVSQLTNFSESATGATVLSLL